MQRSELKLVEDGEGSGSTKAARHDAMLFGTSVSVSPFSVLLDRLLRSLDYVAVLRPLLLIPVWTMLLLGYYRGLDGGPISTYSLPIIGDMPVIWRPDSEILVTIALYSLLMGAVYILNQISDSRTDEINGKLYLVAQGYISQNSLRVQIGVLLFLSVTAALFLFTRIYICLMLLSIVLGVLYSVPPIRFKGRPFLDLLTNAFGFGVVAFAVGWVSRSAFSSELIVRCLPYVICVSAAFINTTIPDMKGDAQSGDITTGVFLGIRKACIASTVLVCAASLISLFLRDFICLTASTLSLPFFIYMTVSNWDESSPKISAVTTATKVSLLVLSLLVALLIPFYLVLLVFTLLLMKVYYQMRFGINYP